MPNNIQRNIPGVPPVRNTAPSPTDAASTAQGATGTSTDGGCRDNTKHHDARPSKQPQTGMTHESSKG